MENKLEQLLNSLIEKGWKPFGEGCHRSPYKRVGIHKNYNKERTYVLFYSDNHTHWKVLRQVVSKESGLWQFVCENNLNYSEDDSIYNVWLKHYAEDDHESPYTYASPVWYIIESALCDEDKLEEFLLNSIKLD